MPAAGRIFSSPPAALGPTYDDLTKQTICEVFGKPLVLHRDILEEIREFYEGTVHAPMPENNTQQAELPGGLCDL